MKFDIHDLFTMACAHDWAMDGTVGPIIDILDRADVVFGVFPKLDEPSGLYAFLIKGRPTLDAIYAGSEGRFVIVTAINFDDRLTSIATAFMLGDGRDDHGMFFPKGSE